MTITIEHVTLEGVSKGYTVRHGDKYADDIAFEEMLALVAALLMPEDRSRYRAWMKTAAEWEQWQQAITTEREYIGKDL